MTVQSQQSSAQGAFLSFLQSGAQGVWSIDNLPEGGVDNLFSAPPDSIYDLNGGLLFKRYTNDWVDSTTAIALTTNQKEFGSPVVSIGVGNVAKIADKIANVTEFIRTKELKLYDNDSRIICYSYPKLGLRVINERKDEFIVDIFTQEIVPVKGNAFFQEGQPVCWSLLDKIQQLQKSNKGNFDSRVTHYNNVLLNYKDKTSEKIRTLNLALPDNKQVCISGITLFPQQGEEWCADAVAQMILSYYGIQLAQSEIANAMNTGPNGTTIQDQISGFSKLSNGRYTAVLEEPAAIKDAISELNASRPVKSAIPAHARLVAGWKSSSADASPQWLYVYDPYPPNTGNIYWETWGAVQHTNFLFVRPK